MESDGPQEWHVAPGDGEARVADPDLDLDDDDDDELWTAPPEAVFPAGPPRGRGRARGNAFSRYVFGGNSSLATVLVAIAAAAVGAAVGLAFLRSPGPAAPAASIGSPSAGSGASAAPAASAPATFGPAPGSGGGYQQLQIVGTVTAVNSTSITIGGNGPSITGTFTGTTRFSGSVTSPAGIKVGDQVAASLTGTPARLTVATIQDPAQ